MRLNLKSLLFALALIAGTSACSDKATEKKSIMDDEIRNELSLKRNLINFNRASGMLSDVLREQKRVFIANKADKKNEIALKVEELMNEASLFASQDNYDKSFDILQTVHGILLASIKELNGNKE